MKWKIVSLVIILIFRIDLAFATGRIYGGYPIDIKDAPYMVHIVGFMENPGKDGNAYECGGTILRANLIMTAGHCIVDESTGKLFKPDKLYVTVGSTVSQNQGVLQGILHRVAKTYPHPEYTGRDNHWFHDISIIELVDNIIINENSQLVDIARIGDNPAKGTDVIVSGWGKNPENPNDKRLYQVHLNVITAERCHYLIAGGSVEEIDQHQICGEAPNKSSCQGDSGGPFIDTTTNRQIGIVSYGAQPCTVNRPGVYTRVTDNLDFINNVIENTHQRCLRNM